MVTTGTTNPAAEQQAAQGLSERLVAEQAAIAGLEAELASSQAHYSDAIEACGRGAPEWDGEAVAGARPRVRLATAGSELRWLERQLHQHQRALAALLGQRPT